MNQALNFDPLKFLDISTNNLKNQEKDALSASLLNKISQYIFIRISELLSIDDVKKTKNSEDVFTLTQAKIPDLNSKMKIFLADFKIEFDKNLKK